MEESKPFETREAKAVGLLEKLSRRVDARIDVQKVLERLSPTAQIYVKHLVMSGPSTVEAAAKACELTNQEIEAALAELEAGISSIRK
jgi:hypothetical protein